MLIKHKNYSEMVLWWHTVGMGWHSMLDVQMEYCCWCRLQVTGENCIKLWDWDDLKHLRWRDHWVPCFPLSTWALMDLCFGMCNSTWKLVVFSQKSFSAKDWLGPTSAQKPGETYFTCLGRMLPNLWLPNYAPVLNQSCFFGKLKLISKCLLKEGDWLPSDFSTESWQPEKLLNSLANQGASHQRLKIKAFVLSFISVSTHIPTLCCSCPYPCLYPLLFFLLPIPYLSLCPFLYLYLLYWIELSFHTELHPQNVYFLLWDTVLLSCPG